MRFLGNRNMPSHNLLRSFECAARHESFTQAAEELRLTQSAVSRQVNELEGFIGAPLFRRVGRRVVLTDAGRRFAEDLAIDLENIKQSVVRAISDAGRKSTLRVGTLPTFASRWLIPRLPTFLADHPEIEIRLETRTIPFDLVRERFDVAIHFGTANWPEARMSKLFDEEMLPVASPRFRDAYSASNPASLAQAPLLHLITRERAWVDWFAANNITDNHLLAGRHFDQFSMVIAGAVNSLGAALLPSYLIESELERGILVPLSQMRLRTHSSYFVVSVAGQVDKQINTFIRWLISASRRRVMTIAH